MSALDAALDPGAEVVVQALAPAGDIPNNPRCPLLAYRRVARLAGPDPAAFFEALFAANGWVGAWRNGIFPFHHFHPCAHEVLGIYDGEVTVRFGGEPGFTLTAGPGDVVVVPAGVGHKKLASSGALGVVGAYPPGQDPRVSRGAGGAGTAVARQVEAVPVPARDPVFGERGPVIEHWPSTPTPG